MGDGGLALVKGGGGCDGEEGEERGDCSVDTHFDGVEFGVQKVKEFECSYESMVMGLDMYIRRSQPPTCAHTTQSHSMPIQIYSILYCRSVQPMFSGYGI